MQFILQFDSECDEKREKYERKSALHTLRLWLCDGERRKKNQSMAADTTWNKRRETKKYRQIGRNCIWEKSRVDGHFNLKLLENSLLTVDYFFLSSLFCRPGAVVTSIECPIWSELNGKRVKKDSRLLMN